MAEYVGGELALNPVEVSDARWLTVDDMPSGRHVRRRPGILSRYPSLSRFLKQVAAPHFFGQRS
jgi:NADH pyrophosphatase NudC (nudix superfamily)